MERFYNNLAKGTPQSPVAKAEALRQAQLELLRGNDTAEAQMPSGMQEAKDSTPPLSVEQQDDSSPTIAKRNSFRHPYYWAPFILMGNSL
jgi:CHAT domain-containing protein